MLRSERVRKAFADVAPMGTKAAFSITGIGSRTGSVFLDLSRRAFDLSKTVGLIGTLLRCQTTALG